ncbi:zinc ribbon domain-containing protein [Tepidicella baoligensis]|uniref:zinc ribbon domain-containing protein n=1 Tax=Tepidicella baoligensis TaxID=2707016 RepID=UPI0015D9CE9A|nr:zinc ribbon domain-containing protein [Tepidicella baoligensis]
MKSQILSENPYSIFRIPEALTCWQAVMVMATSGLVAMLLFALGGMLTQISWFFLFLLSLLAIIVFMAGVNGAGICLTDFVNKSPFRGVLGYLIAGLISLPKLIGASIILFILYIIAILAVAIILLICKIPGIGPLLLVVGIPMSILIVTMTMIGSYMAASIVAPAIWDGEKVLNSISITWEITKRYPFAAFFKIFGGFVISTIIGSIIFGLTFVASTIVAGMAIPIIGSSISLDIPSMMAGSFGGGGHISGALIGFGLTFAAVSAFVFLLPLMVGILTWREFSQKVDLENIRQKTSVAIEEAKKKADEIKEKAKTQSAPMTAGSTQTGEEQLAATPASINCPQCKGTVQEGDRFCEHCGHKLI